MRLKLLLNVENVAAKSHVRTYRRSTAIFASRPGWLLAVTTLRCMSAAIAMKCLRVMSPVCAFRDQSAEEQSGLHDTSSHSAYPPRIVRTPRHTLGFAFVGLHRRSPYRSGSTIFMRTGHTFVAPAPLVFPCACSVGRFVAVLARAPEWAVQTALLFSYQTYKHHNTPTVNGRQEISYSIVKEPGIGFRPVKHLNAASIAS